MNQICLKNNVEKLQRVIFGTSVSAAHGTAQRVISSGSAPPTGITPTQRTIWQIAPVARISIILGLTTLVMAFIWVAWPRFGRESIGSGSVKASAAPPVTVTCLGKFEPNGELVRLHSPTSSQESLISVVCVDEGQRISRGQILAVLDSEQRLKANLQQAEGQLGVACAKLAVTKAGAKSGELSAQKYEIRRLELDREARLAAQESVVGRLQSAYRQAGIDAQRYLMLRNQGAISQFEYDQKALAFQIAKENLAEARSVLRQIASTSEAQVESAKCTLSRIEEVRTVDVQASQAEVVQARAMVAQAKASLEQAYIKSPIDGSILKIHAHAGEQVGDKGFADIGQTQQMFAVAEIYQSDIYKIRLGQHARITCEAAPGLAISGTVSRIGQEVRRQSVVNSDPSANVDERVVEVKIRLDAESSRRVCGLSNAQVTVVVQL